MFRSLTLFAIIVLFNMASIPITTWANFEIDTDSAQILIETLRNTVNNAHQSVPRGGLIKMDSSEFYEFDVSLAKSISNLIPWAERNLPLEDKHIDRLVESAQKYGWSSQVSGRNFLQVEYLPPHSRQALFGFFDYLLRKVHARYLIRVVVYEDEERGLFELVQQMEFTVRKAKGNKFWEMPGWFHDEKDLTESDKQNQIKYREAVVLLGESIQSKLGPLNSNDPQDKPALEIRNQFNELVQRFKKRNPLGQTRLCKDLF